MAATKNSVRKKREQKKKCDSSGSRASGKVACGSATQDPWLGNRKVGFQVVGEDQSRSPRRGIVDACKFVVRLLGNAWKSFYLFEEWKEASQTSM